METYFDNMTLHENSGRLLHDLKELRESAEDLVKATATNLAEKSREEVNRAIARLKASCRQIEENTIARANITDRWVRQYPYPTLGMAFGIGLVLGCLLSRK